MHLSAVRKTMSEGHQSTPLDQSLLSTLCAVVVLPQLQGRPETLEYAFDVSALLSDDFTDDQHLAFAKFEAQRLADPRVFFLLGSSPSSDGWLGLVTSQAVAGTTASASSVGTPGRIAYGQQASSSTPAPGARPQPGQRASAGSSQQKQFNPPVQYPLKRWELLPDQGNTGAVNDTAISLSLFGARKAQ